MLSTHTPPPACVLASLLQAAWMRYWEDGGTRLMEPLRVVVVLDALIELRAWSHVAVTGRRDMRIASSTYAVLLQQVCSVLDRCAAGTLTGVVGDVQQRPVLDTLRHRRATCNALATTSRSSSDSSSTAAAAMTTVKCSWCLCNCYVPAYVHVLAAHSGLHCVYTTATCATTPATNKRSDTDNDDDADDNDDEDNDDDDDVPCATQRACAVRGWALNDTNAATWRWRVALHAALLPRADDELTAYDTLIATQLAMCCTAADLDGGHLFDSARDSADCCRAGDDTRVGDADGVRATALQPLLLVVCGVPVPPCAFVEALSCLLWHSSVRCGRRRTGDVTAWRPAVCTLCDALVSRDTHDDDGGNSGSARTRPRRTLCGSVQRAQTSSWGEVTVVALEQWRRAYALSLLDVCVSQHRTQCAHSNGNNNSNHDGCGTARHKASVVSMTWPLPTCRAVVDIVAHERVDDDNNSNDDDHDDEAWCVLLYTTYWCLHDYWACVRRWHVCVCRQLCDAARMSWATAHGTRRDIATTSMTTTTTTLRCVSAARYAAAVRDVVLCRMQQQAQQSSPLAVVDSDDDDDDDAYCVHMINAHDMAQWLQSLYMEAMPQCGWLTHSTTEATAAAAATAAVTPWHAHIGGSSTASVIRHSFCAADAQRQLRTLMQHPLLAFAALSPALLQSLLCTTTHALRTTVTRQLTRLSSRRGSHQNDSTHTQACLLSLTDAVDEQMTWCVAVQLRACVDDVHMRAYARSIAARRKAHARQRQQHHSNDDDDAVRCASGVHDTSPLADAHCCCAATLAMGDDGEAVCAASSSSSSSFCSATRQMAADEVCMLHALATNAPVEEALACARAAPQQRRGDGDGAVMRRCVAALLDAAYELAVALPL